MRPRLAGALRRQRQEELPASSGSGLPRDGQFVPVVAVRTQVSRRTPGWTAERTSLAARGVCVKPVRLLPPSPETNSRIPEGDGVPEGVHRREALVAVIVAGEDQVDAGRGEVPPEGVERGVVPVHAGGEAGRVPEGDGAPGGMRGELLPQPVLLRGTDPATAHGAAVRVQRDGPPGAEVERRTRGRRCRLGAAGGDEVAVVPGRPGRVVLVIARRRVGDRLSRPQVGS